ncbi:MAG: transcription antitermination factor NusB [Alphaproteobacteria bacterium]
MSDPAAQNDRRSGSGTPAGAKDKAKQRRHTPRSAARLAAVQALYQMELSGRGARDVIEEFIHHRFAPPTIASDLVEGAAPVEAEEGFFVDLVKGVVDRQTEIDRTVNAVLASGWRLERLDSILRALLRTGTFELLGRDDIPEKVVINEYVDLAHAFFDTTDVRFVNGALDNVAKTLHPENDHPSAEG